MAKYIAFDPDKHTGRYACGNVMMPGDVVLGDKQGSSYVTKNEVYLVTDVAYRVDKENSFIYTDGKYRNPDKALGALCSYYRLLFRCDDTPDQISKLIAVKAAKSCAEQVNRIEKAIDRVQNQEFVVVEGIPMKHHADLKRAYVDALNDERAIIGDVVLRLFCQAAPEFSEYYKGS